MLTDSQVLTEWSRRRSATWRAVRIWLLLAVVAGLVFAYLARTPVSDMGGSALLGMFLDFILLMISMLVVILRTNSLYRCPKCNAVPMGKWSLLGPSSFGFRSGVALDPDRCPNCGVTLR